MEEVRRRILVVDDAPMFRELESLFLARSGEILTAEDGNEALRIAQEASPDVIVTDFSMPGMRGDQLCRRVKADPDLARIPVVMVTGYDSGEEHEIAVRAGADDVLEKPLNRLSLIQAVNRFLALTVRGLVRVPFETDVRIASEAGETWGRTLNVSRGGMFVTLQGDSPPEPRTEIELEFDLPEMRASLRPTAKVVWRRRASGPLQPGMGVQFLKLDHEAIQALDEFVYEHAPPGEAEAVPRA